jgi:L-fuculose-phosphate aldolase
MEVRMMGYRSGQRSSEGERGETEHRREIVEVGKRLWQRGYIAANDGNITVRLDEEHILATPTGLSKGFLSPDQIVKVSMAGKQIEGHLRMSSEVLLHLEIYRTRCDVCAIVHAHPVYATGFAVAGLALEKPILPEAVVNLGGIPLAAYGKPGTAELPETLKPYLADHDAFLMANHGAVTLGSDVFQAYYRMETLEHYAQISFVARMLGNENVFNEDQVRELMEVRKDLGLGFPRPCSHCGLPHTSQLPGVPEEGGEAWEELVRQITSRVVAQLE